MEGAAADSAAGQSGIREFTASRDNLAACLVAIIFEFEMSDILVLRSVGSATNTATRICYLLGRLGVKVVKTEREAFRDGSHERYVVKMTLQRNMQT